MTKAYRDILYNVRENDIAEKKLLKTFVWFFFFLGGGQNVAAKWGGDETARDGGQKIG